MVLEEEVTLLTNLFVGKPLVALPVTSPVCPTTSRRGAVFINTFLGDVGSLWF